MGQLNIPSAESRSESCANLVCVPKMGTDALLAGKETVYRQGGCHRREGGPAELENL